ncbi:MAG: M20/M25/M40 family metallo-hydrolase [Candidatus Kapaibacterium sp.]
MIDFLIKMMEVDSTSGKEENIIDTIKDFYNPVKASLEIQEISNGKHNLFYKWGMPKIIFCSHFDTVPPYIPPSFNDKRISGRGSCDAKGQIAVMSEVCLQLEKEGKTNFGLLMLAGEEVGSYGALTANKLIIGCNYVIVGEPTQNKLIKAGKGNILFDFTIRGRSAHSGYPKEGDDAIERFRLFLNGLRNVKFEEDELLGITTYNVGCLSSENAHNVIPSLVTFKIFFRTTFATHNIIESSVKKICNDNIEYNIKYGDEPIMFHTVEGFETDKVSYGSDAPELYNLGKRLLYGPGSIQTAHTKEEHILMSDIHRAVEDLKNIYYKLEEEIESED